MSYADVSSVDAGAMISRVALNSIQQPVWSVSQAPDWVVASTQRLAERRIVVVNSWRASSLNLE